MADPPTTVSTPSESAAADSAPVDAPPPTMVNSTNPPLTDAPIPSEPAPGMQPLAELFENDSVSWSLPPRFGAVGTAMPLVVEVPFDPDEIESIAVTDLDGDVLTALSPAAGRFWNGAIPAEMVTGEQLTFRAVAQLASGNETVASPDWTVPLNSGTGAVVEQRPLQLKEATVPIDADLLGLFFPEGEGDVSGPGAVAAISSDEVAVLDTINERLVCFGLDGSLRCDIALPVRPDGDLLPLGDGTLLVIDFEALGGDQSVRLIRVDPDTAALEVVYTEDPLVVEGFGPIGTNSTFELDRTTGTAWLGIPEIPDLGEDPDPDRYLYADAFHLGATVTRGPTVSRPAFRPDTATAGLALVDGGAWVRLDGIGSLPSVLAAEVTPAGDLVMLVGWFDDDRSTTGLARWTPGAETYEFAPIEFEFFGGSTTRILAVLDDDRIVVLDAGDRLREFTLESVS